MARSRVSPGLVSVVLVAAVVAGGAPGAGAGREACHYDGHERDGHESRPDAPASHETSAPGKKHPIFLSQPRCRGKPHTGPGARSHRFTSS